MNKPSVIEINGHRYDAVSGKLLDGVQRAVFGVGSVDGIVRAKSRHIKRQSQRSIHELKRHTQRSQTLMRQAVKKPSAKKVALKKSLINHHPARDLRHKLVGLKPRIKARNEVQVTKHHNPQVHEGEIVARPHKAALSTPMPSISNNLSHQKLEQLLDYALVNADAHQQERRRGKGVHRALHILPKWLSISLMVILVLAVGSFIAWQKIPAISLRVAASQAHVDAAIPSIPGYAASSPASVKNGALSIQYASVADTSQTATVTKKPAATQDVNSLAKKECPNDKQVQTFQQSGSVGVICGQSNKAIGVTNGIITEIKGNGGRPIDNNVSNAITAQ